MKALIVNCFYYQLVQAFYNIYFYEKNDKITHVYDILCNLCFSKLEDKKRNWILGTSVTLNLWICKDSTRNNETAKL